MRGGGIAKKLAHDADLIQSAISIGAWPTPAISASWARGATPGHGFSDFMRQQVRIFAAQQQGRAADHVIERPQVHIHAAAGNQRLNVGHGDEGIK